MKFILGVIFTAFLIGITTPVAEAIMASPFPFVETNSDGTSTGPIFIRGGPGDHWFEDMDGYTICPTDANNTRRLKGMGVSRDYFYCSEDDSGDLVPRVDLKVGKTSPRDAGINRGARKSKDKVMEKCGEFCLRNRKDRLLGEEGQGQRKLVGTIQNIIVLMRFKDHTSRTLPSASDVDDLMNMAGTSPIVPSGSVKTFYLENSANQLTLQTTVTNWVTLDYTEAQCADGQTGFTNMMHTCIANALNKVQAAGLNFGNFDNGKGNVQAIGFLHSGYGAECT
jgi:hypothetical protein